MDGYPETKVACYHLIYYESPWKSKWIKELKSTDNLCDIQKTLKNKFLKQLARIHKFYEDSGKCVRIVYPPWKISDKSKPMKFVSWYEEEQNYSQHNILIKSPDYEKLHRIPKEIKENKKERNRILESVFKHWKFEAEPFPFMNKDIFVFVDDFFTTGATFKYVKKFLEYKIPNCSFSLNKNRYLSNFTGLFLARSKPDYEELKKGYINILLPDLSNEINKMAKNTNLENLSKKGQRIFAEEWEK